jgi:putative membrane protein
MLIRVVAYAVATIVATLILGTISERLISFDSPGAVLLFGAIAGGINAVVKPVLQLLTLPLTCLTFGLFAIVLNAGLFWLGAWITPGVETSVWGAMFGSLIASLANGVIFSVLDEQ